MTNPSQKQKAARHLHAGPLSLLPAVLAREDAAATYTTLVARTLATLLSIVSFGT
jgi:hypothetical protein